MGQSLKLGYPNCTHGPDQVFWQFFI